MPPVNGHSVLTNERDFPYPRAGEARTASKCQEWDVVLQSKFERGSHGQGYYCGDRPGKERVLAARGGRCGTAAAQAYGPARSAHTDGGSFISVPDRDGSLLGGSRVGPPVPGARPHGEADGAQVRGTLQEERQERRQRCRSDLRGGDAAEHALCAGEVRRAAGPAGDAPGQAGQGEDSRTAATTRPGCWGWLNAEQRHCLASLDGCLASCINYI